MLEEELNDSLKRGPVRVLLTRGIYVDIIDKIGIWWKYQYKPKKTMVTGLVKTSDIQGIQPRFDNII